MRKQPKKNITQPNKYKSYFGNMVRKSYQNTILEKAPIFPKPLEYDDIDKAMFDFVDKVINITIDGVDVPTYTLYSNQRFSEYTQMWEHTDENGNLFLNFKTINREKNPSFGGNQGEKWNIPVNRKYTLLQQQVLDDNGTESYEIYTMRQPYTVDLSYSVSFITTTLDYINHFNQKINRIFASRQYYIRPNGHYIPVVVEDINDETSYSISERKFYVQIIRLRVMAYIIEPEDFEVKKYPKRVNILTEGNKFRKKVCVEIEEDESPIENKELTVNITFQPFVSKTEFDFDTDMTVTKVLTDNVRVLRVMINDTLYYVEKTFKIKNNDNVRIVVKPIEYDKGCNVKFVGYENNSYFNVNNVPENVSEQEITHEIIDIK